MTHVATNNPSHHDDCLFSMDHLHEAALGILEPEDRERLEHHLAECDVCRAELSELDATVNLLPLSVDQAAPRPHVKQSLLTRMETELALPPASTTIAKTSRRRPDPRRNAPLARRPLWTYGSVFAGLCVALVAIAVWNILPFSHDTSNAPDGQMSVLAMEASDCEDCHEDTRGHIGAHMDDTDGMVVAWNLDPAQKHEVWCVNSLGEKYMVGELEVDSTGTAMQTIRFPEAVGGYDQIYVARNDGTEELTVAPNKIKTNGDSSATPPG